MVVSWEWLKDYIGNVDITAEQAADLLGTHAFEVEDVRTVDTGDTVIDIDVLPNRSSDCLSHRGVARELASILNITLENDPLCRTVSLQDTDVISIDIKDVDVCPRFSASLIQDVQVAESPTWLKNRLEAIGQKSINNIVDATNYVMFALGQPLHAYDADLFPRQGDVWNFVIRTAVPGEKIALLPEKTDAEDRVIECTGTELLIVDGTTNTAIGLAGVKGGAFAGVHEGTKNIIIEAAHFEPVQTRKTARRLGIVIDASKRFENEPSRDLVPFAQDMIIQLIKDIAGGTYAGTNDVYEKVAVKKTSVVSLGRVNAVLGLNIQTEEIQSLLQRIGVSVVVESSGLHVTPPFERTDLVIEEDYIEEIGRLYGYRHVLAIEPKHQPVKVINKRQFYSEKIRQVLLDHGFSEVITSSFRKKDVVQLKNALASDKSYLRSNLTKNIEQTLDRNINFTDLLGLTEVRVFEIGTVFEKVANSVSEHVSLAFGVRKKLSGYSGKEDVIVKETISALESTLEMELPFSLQKGVAELNFSEILKNLNDPHEYNLVGEVNEIQYQTFSVYPFVTRDIALWVEDTKNPKDVEAVLRTAAGNLLARITLFDEFEKEGRKSYAYRLVFQSHEKTLTGEEVDVYMESVYSAVQKEDWEVR